MDIKEYGKQKNLLLEIMNKEGYKPLKLRGFKELLNLSKEETEKLEKVFVDLIKEGKIIKTNKKKYMLTEEEELLTGKFIAHPKGFGFVEIEDREQDIFIPRDGVNNAMNGDSVAVEITVEKVGTKREEGKILKILEHGVTEVIGVFEASDGFGFVVPDNKKLLKDIFIPRGKSKAAMSGHKVVAKLYDWGGVNKKPEGEITEIIGHISDPETEIKAMVLAYGIPNVFPEEVMQEVEKTPEVLTEEMIAAEDTREDFRKELTITIDGKDAKDLDDAITLKRVDDGYELGVHIADVSNYVKEGSELDKEAILRGTSTYLIDRVIPMLPHRLSNGICSLNAGEDRFALSCIMNIDKEGNVTGHRVIETVINVNERMNYSDVHDIVINNDNELMERYNYLLDMFYDMLKVSKLLKQNRVKRGSIDFDSDESKFILDEQGRIKDIVHHDRNEATKIIEEFMLLANETVSEHFYWQQIPFLYRTHDEPDPDRIEILKGFIANLGFSLKGTDNIVHPMEFQKLLNDVKGSEAELVVNRLCLRSMQQARYTVEATGHFGLAAKYYSHFTSPIRRYPDLQIHRIIKEMIHGDMTPKRIKHYDKILTNIAEQCSVFERRAEGLEREVVKYKKCEYMESHVGEKYTGTISGITKWGIYVELPNTIEGLIQISNLKDDYYEFVEDQLILVGERHNKKFQLGQEIEVVVSRVDKRLRTIDFEPPENMIFKENKDSKDKETKKDKKPERQPLVGYGDIPKEIEKEFKKLRKASKSKKTGKANVCYTKAKLKKIKEKINSNDKGKTNFKAKAKKKGPKNKKTKK